MKHIQEYVMQINEELDGAKDYAEKALYWKYEGNSNRYKTYLDMANAELDHALKLHSLAVEDVAKLKERGYTPPQEMQDVWDKSHAMYVEKMAWVRQMLAM